MNFCKEFFIILFISFLLGCTIKVTVEHEPAKIESAPLQVGTAAFGTNYYWADTLKARSTAVDSYFTTKWEDITLEADSVNIWYRAGAPDTSDWSNREWMRLTAFESIRFGPATQLRRLEWKTTGTTGDFFMNGHKRTAQY